MMTMPLFADSGGHYKDGWCYLMLFADAHVPAVSKVGPMPTVADMRRYTNANAKSLVEGKFELVLQTHSTGIVGHVVPATVGNGVSAFDLLAACHKDLRLGAEPRPDSAVGVKVEHCDKGSVGGELANVPADLPYNIPDAGLYPWAHYSGLRVFIMLIDPEARWTFIVTLGGQRDVTPVESFWTKSFRTTTMLDAYFQLREVQRAQFLAHVRWVRDPLPGRPGGVQTPPTDWPAMIPTPVHHVMTRYAGIKEWVITLSPALQEMCRLALFGVHEPFDPIWWMDYQKTVDVYAMYTRLPPVEQLTFRESVYWLPDAGQAMGIGQGYCYLHLFKEEVRDVVRGKLGYNPRAVDVKQALLDRPQCWNDGQFHIEAWTGPSMGRHGQSQWHVSPSPLGFDVADIVPLLEGDVRVGASSDLNALANLQMQDPLVGKPTVFPETPIGGGAGMELGFNVYAITGVDPKLPSVLFDVMREPAFSMLLGAFESVQLLSASFTIQLSTGSQNAAYAAIVGVGINLDNLSDWHASPVNAIIHGSDQGVVSGALTLPENHPFDRELRSNFRVGNPYPTFRFAAGGSAGVQAVVKGRITVKCRGQNVLGHVRIGGSRLASFKANLKVATASLPTVTAGRTALGKDIYGGDDDESEDEPAPAKKLASPPRPNSSVSRG